MTALQAEISDRLVLPPGWDAPCEGSVHHSPTPLMTEAYDLATFRTGLVLNPPKDPVHLCGVCADNLSLFLRLCETARVPWETQRRFGNKIRALGDRARAHLETTD